MDTINNLANAASKAIWGESQSHEEPVSGKSGNVAAGEPYDAGNIEDNKAALSAGEKKDTGRPDEPSTTTRVTGTSDPEPMPKPELEAATKPRFVEEKPTTTKVTGTSEPEPMPKPDIEAATKPRFVEEQPSTTRTTGITVPVHLPKPDTETTTKSQFTEDLPTTATKPHHEEARDQSSHTSSAGPAKFAPSAIGMRDDSTKVQNDTSAPPPSSDERSHIKSHTSAASTNIPGVHDTKDTTRNDTAPKPSIAEHHSEVMDKKQAIQDESNPDVRLVGRGPRPLEQVAREHGGDAGAATQAPGLTTGADAGHRRKDSGKGLGREDEGHKAGTGEHHVKTTGLAADGGDFDAAKPGAGREADRLLDAKGVPSGVPHAHHGADTSAATGSDNGTHAGTHTGAEGKEKVGLKDKIKAKLHKH